MAIHFRSLLVSVEKLCVDNVERRSDGVCLCSNDNGLKRACCSVGESASIKFCCYLVLKAAAATMRLLLRVFVPYLVFLNHLYRLIKYNHRILASSD